ncbi:MAG: microcin ABC transporter permease, partial [Acidobacteria bacterium]|nr:microcin ABC transporter permease [Acidobacteriota bacterium]
MLLYVLRRILLMVPTLVGVLLINFVIIQAAPGGPVDQAIARLQGTGLDAGVGLLGGGSGATLETELTATGGIDPALIEELERQFGFDRPAHVRFFIMLRDYLRFDLGESFYQDVPVIDLVLDRLPVSMSLGLWTLLIVYSVSIPLGIRKATADG